MPAQGALACNCMHANEPANRPSNEAAARAYVGLGRDVYAVLISRSMSDVTQFGGDSSLPLRRCSAWVAHPWRWGQDALFLCEWGGILRSNTISTPQRAIVDLWPLNSQLHLPIHLPRNGFARCHSGPLKPSLCFSAADI